MAQLPQLVVRDPTTISRSNLGQVEGAAEEIIVLDAQFGEDLLLCSGWRRESAERDDRQHLMVACRRAECC